VGWKESPLVEPSSLFTLAEIAIGMAGFSAIVVMFKRRDSGQWHSADADQFNGMVLHAMAAAFFCVLPAIIEVFTDDPARIWLVGSAILGVQIIAHTAGILGLASTTRATRTVVVVGASAAVILQALNVFGVGFSREFQPYLAGVMWHMLHAGGLFVMLILVRPSEIQGE
jgi:hypothetical protein